MIVVGKYDVQSTNHCVNYNMNYLYVLLLMCSLFSALYFAMLISQYQLQIEALAVINSLTGTLW